ncbi:hypothetical protein RRG08_045599 [Elysia crispata]|uniref:Mediator of RNA polymerase II transcription subunit 15 n=1 Tax=Elysia crispata TaxID=231223 RepID=A0AAE1ADR2_9GAST|nr:hypothetical protein RRG08_045599 [Elysia crispata]
MAEPNNLQEDWPAPSFRETVVERLEEAKRNSQAQMTKSSAEMEELVFQKARNKAEYCQFISRVLNSVNSDHAKKEKHMANQQATGMMPNMGQVVMPGMRQQGPVPGPDQDPINALQNLAGQGAAGMNRQQQQMGGMMPGMQGMMNPQQQQQAQSRMEMMRPPHMQHPRPQQLHGMHRPPQLARQDAFMVTSPQTMPGMPSQPLPASSMGYQGPGGPVRTMGPMGMAAQYMSRDPNMVAMNMQGPNQTSPIQMMPSPMTSHSGMMPSPVGTRSQMGVPSPNQMLHTPGSAVAEPSPGPPSTSQEELEYRKKLEKLSGYIEPLRKFVQDSEKKTDEDSIKNHKKMKSLLSILTTKNRYKLVLKITNLQ